MDSHAGIEKPSFSGAKCWLRQAAVMRPDSIHTLFLNGSQPRFRDARSLRRRSGLVASAANRHTALNTKGTLLPIAEQDSSPFCILQTPTSTRLSMLPRESRTGWVYSSSRGR